MEIQIDTTVSFDNILQSTKKVVHHIGGTRSGKSYAVLQYLLVIGMKNKLRINIVRKTVPSLKRTIIKDWVDILKTLNIYRTEGWNTSDRIYTLANGTTYNFLNTDDAEKLRGVKSDILFIDEANEVDEESYFQLSIRTSDKVILAYNPTVSPYHWLRQMGDCDRYVTTYKDNPFLDKSIIKGIEDLKERNPKYWKIYGLGEFAPNERTVYKFTVGEMVEEEAELVGHGLDFGFSQDPTAMVSVFRNGNRLWLVERLYEKGLVTSDIIRFLENNVNRRDEIWCDSADPRLIEEIYRSGFNAKPVKKGSDSIRFGISVMNNYELYVPKGCQNMINELYGYQYAQDKNGYTTDVPEPGLDHLLDAARYLTMSRLSNKAATGGRYVISVR